MWQHRCDWAAVGQEACHGLGSRTHRDCARARSCLLPRAISMTQLNHLVRRHYLVQRKRGAGCGELAARRFAHHYVPLAALKSESQGISYSLRGLPRAWAEVAAAGPREGGAAPTSLFLPHIVTPQSISQSHHHMARHPGGAALDHRLGLRGRGHLHLLLQRVPFPDAWITPLDVPPAPAAGEQAFKSPSASPSSVPRSAGVLPPEPRAGMGALGRRRGLL